MLYVLLQYLFLNRWLGCHVPVSKEAACPLGSKGECHDAAAVGMLRVGRGEIIRQNKSKSQRKWESKFKDPTPTNPDH